MTRHHNGGDDALSWCTWLQPVPLSTMPPGNGPVQRSPPPSPSLSVRIPQDCTDACAAPRHRTVVQQHRHYRLLRLLRRLSPFDAFRCTWGIRLEGLVKGTRGRKNPSARRVFGRMLRLRHPTWNDEMASTSASHEATLVYGSDRSPDNVRITWWEPVHMAMAA
jgi:hypothetical protein